MGSWRSFNLRASTLRPAFILGLAAAVLMSVVVVNALTATDLGNSGTESIDVAVNTFQDDADVTVTRLGLFKSTTTTAAVGDSAAGVEATSALPAVNNALTRDNWAYRFTVTESGNTAWQSGEDFRFDVYGSVGSSSETDELATLYCQQAVVDDGAIDGVTATIDLGSATIVHDTFDILVRRQTEGW